MPLRFTPFLGILAGIIATLIILILTVITVIKIKYKYGKAVASSASASPGSSGAPGDRDQNIHYKVELQTIHQPLHVIITEKAWLKVPTSAREVLMGEGNGVASVTMWTFTKRPGPHADTAWAVVG